MLAIFETLFKEQLHTKANAEQGFPLLYFGEDNLIHTALPQLLRRVTKGSDARQDHPIRLRNDLRIIGHNGRFPEIGERRAEGEKIADSIIDNRYHQRIPFVDGISFPARGSVAHAVERALARALKTPSII